MKNKILLLSLLAMCLALYIGGTLAYFTAGETARNVITAGNIKIELIETDAEGRPFQDMTDVMPGTEADKVVNVKNTGTNSCWVRIAVNKEIILAEGKEGTPDLALVAVQYDTECWTQKEGYFYYNEKLEPGETTKRPLFRKVAFDKNMDNLYQGSKARITVAAQAVQSANNGADVLEANGWPAP